MIRIDALDTAAYESALPGLAALLLDAVEHGASVAIAPYCEPGADCVYQRYLDAQPADLARAGVTDAASFTRYYWDQQLRTMQLVAGLTLAGGLIGAVAFDVRRRRPGEPRPAVST